MAQESRNKYLIKNTAIFAIGNMGTKLISFFMVPLYTYALTTAEYGTINTIISICSIIIPLIMCNIGEAIRRYLLDKNSDKSAIQTVEFTWFGFSVIMSGIMYVLLHFIPGYGEYALEMTLFVLGNAFALTTLDYLRGKEKLISYTFCSLLQTFLIAGLNILFLVKFKWGITGYFKSYIIAYFFCGVLAFIIGGQIKEIKNLRFDKKLFADMSKFSLTLVPNSIMWWITNASDKLMITFFISEAATGIYSASAKLPTILSTMNTIMLQAWQYSAIKESESKDKVEYNNKMMQVYMATTSLAGAFLLLINKPFMGIYVSEKFREAWLYSPFLILSAILTTLATFVGTSYYVEKDMKGNLKSATVGAVVNLILNLILIPRIGVTGAAMATCFSYGAVLWYRLRDTYKYMPLKLLSKNTIMLFVVLLVMLGGSFVPSPFNYIILSIGMVLVLIITKECYIGFVKAIFAKVFGKFVKKG